MIADAIRRARECLARQRMIRLTMRELRWPRRRAEIYVDAIIESARLVAAARSEQS